MYKKSWLSDAIWCQLTGLVVSKPSGLNALRVLYIEMEEAKAGVI